MNILCAICQDLLEPSNDIFITPCGHVFHFPCLYQWLEKSSTCPQCRQKVKKDNITRIYFNLSNTEEVVEDSCTLQQKVDSLSFQIRLKETEYKNCRDENVTLRKQNNGLKDKIREVEKELKDKESYMRALKEQSDHWRSQCKDYDKLKAEKESLVRTLETYDNVKMLVIGTSDDVEKMLHQTKDISTLSTYVAIMKRELSTSMNKRKELRATVKRLQQDLQARNMEQNLLVQDHIKRIDELEVELSACQRDKELVQNQLHQLQKLENVNKNTEIVDCETPKVIAKSAISRKRDTTLDFDFDLDIEETSAKKLKRGPETYKISFSPKKNDLISSPVKQTKENEENSPYLPTKSRSVLSLKDRTSQRSGFSLKSKFSAPSFKKTVVTKSCKDPEIAFDGFGGHSKTEMFPVPKSSPNKLKRSANDSSKSKKLKLDGNARMDNFIINLT